MASIQQELIGRISSRRLNCGPFMYQSGVPAKFPGTQVQFRIEDPDCGEHRDREGDERRSSQLAARNIIQTGKLFQNAVRRLWSDLWCIFGLACTYFDPEHSEEHGGEY
jgi:hypothetical protein